MHCRDHAVQLDRAHSEFDAAGVGLTLIGQVSPRHAAHFRRRQGIDLPILADKERESYRAAGAKVATTGELLGPSSVTKGVAATIKSKGKTTQGKVVGHPAQLGGVLLIEPDGSVAWSHMSENAGDNATPQEILDAARAAASG